MRSIRTRFTALTALAIIISIIAVGFVSAQYMRTVANGYLEELLMLKCGNMGEDIDSHFKTIEQCVDTVDFYAEKQLAGVPKEEISSYIDDIDTLFHNEALRTDGVITYYFRTDPERVKSEKGFWYARKEGEDFVPEEPTDIEAYDPGDINHTAWFYIPKEEGKPVWLDPYDNDNLGGVKMISYVRPIVVDSEFLGVAGIDFDYETLKSYLAYDGHFEGAVAFLADKDDRIIVHPEYESGTPVTEISEALGSENLPEGEKLFSVRYQDVNYRVSWDDLSNGMRLYLAVPDKSIKAHWAVFIRNFLLIALLMLAVFAGLSTTISTRIAQPLTELAEAAQRINKGDYDVNLEYKGEDEVGMLTNSFKQLTDHLKAYISDLNDMAYKDALTSVRNMGAFEIYKQMLDDGIKSTERRKPEFAICMFDCNDLKSINDNYGHDKGDLYLKNACSLICNVFTHSPVFRIGGDEFICVLQNDDFRNRIKLLKQFSDRMEEVNAEAEEPWEKIDVAAGMAVYAPALDSSVQDVFNRADNKMYRNKNRSKEQSDEDSGK